MPKHLDSQFVRLVRKRASNNPSKLPLLYDNIIRFHLLKKTNSENVPKTIYSNRENAVN